MTTEAYHEGRNAWCDVCICSDQIVVLDRPLAVMTKVQAGDKRTEDGAGLILSRVLLEKIRYKLWPRLRARPFPLILYRPVPWLTSFLSLQIRK